MTANVQDASPPRLPPARVRGRLLEEYRSLCAKFELSRFDRELLKTKMQILGFVQGLRFSALVTYSIRRILKKLVRNAALTASWGVIYDEDTNAFSRECDVIVHEDVSVDAWNGGDSYDGPVMDFRFVPPEHAKVVISCKSELSSIDDKMKVYAQDVRDYVDHIWLFAECCEARKVDTLRESARKAGYERLWYLYTFQRGRVGQVANEQGWLEFAEELRSL